MSALYAQKLDSHQLGWSHRDKYNLPIYTLRLPGQLIYIVNSKALISQIQRYIKIMIFKPMEVEAASNVMGVGPSALAVIDSDDLNEDDA